MASEYYKKTYSALVEGGAKVAVDISNLMALGSILSILVICSFNIAELQSVKRKKEQRHCSKAQPYSAKSLSEFPFKHRRCKIGMNIQPKN